MYMYSHTGNWSSWFHCIADGRCPTQRTSGGQREGRKACRAGEKVALLQKILFLYASERTRSFLGYFPREGENELPVASGEKGKCWVGCQLSWEWKTQRSMVDQRPVAEGLHGGLEGLCDFTERFGGKKWSRETTGRGLGETVRQ